jgi:NAD(P)-dependent dehydrogenase (short-subunit alcohol dehydrogenase family)
MRLKNKVAVISGGATGMGGAASELFACEGAKVAIIDINLTEARTTASRINDKGGIAFAFGADVSKSAEVAAAIEAVLSTYGPPNILFNHAGKMLIKPFLETTEEDWDHINDVNVKSMYLVTKAVLPHMIAAGGGSIVCTSSISAQLATPTETLYNSSKGACHMFARAIAIEFRDRNIRCNTVCPGFIRTPHGEREIEGLLAHGIDASDVAIAGRQGRIGEAMEVAKAALFLASDDASFVNGAHLFVDNGFSAT